MVDVTPGWGEPRIWASSLCLFSFCVFISAWYCRFYGVVLVALLYSISFFMLCKFCSHGWLMHTCYHIYTLQLWLTRGCLGLCIIIKGLVVVGVQIVSICSLKIMITKCFWTKPLKTKNVDLGSHPCNIIDMFCFK